MLYRWRWFAAIIVFAIPYVILRYATGVRVGIVGVALLAAIAWSVEYIIRSNYEFLAAIGSSKDDEKRT